MKNKMKKTILASIFLFVFLSLILSSGVITAQNDNPKTSIDDRDSDNAPTPPEYRNTAKTTIESGPSYDDRVKVLSEVWPEWIASRIATWELGALGDQGIGGTTLKYFVLALVTLLIYSALTYANFPDSFASAGGSLVRFLISVIVGLISTFMITTNELLTMLQSYTALGISLTLFFPIMILMFFTIVTARAASPIGIFGQKILWLIYSLYLFFRTSLYLFAANNFQFFNFGKGESPLIKNVVTFFLGENVAKNVNSFDPAVLVIMLIVSVAVFLIFVWRNRAVNAWISKEARESEIEAQKSMLERSHAYDKLRAEEVKRT